MPEVEDIPLKTILWAYEYAENGPSSKHMRRWKKSAQKAEKAYAGLRQSVAKLRKRSAGIHPASEQGDDLLRLTYVDFLNYYRNASIEHIRKYLQTLEGVSSRQCTKVYNLSQGLLDQSRNLRQQAGESGSGAAQSGALSQQREAQEQHVSLASNQQSRKASEITNTAQPGASSTTIGQEQQIPRTRNEVAKTHKAQTESVDATLQSFSPGDRKMIQELQSNAADLSTEVRTSQIDLSTTRQNVQTGLDALEATQQQLRAALQRLDATEARLKASNAKLQQMSSAIADLHKRYVKYEDHQSLMLAAQDTERRLRDTHQALLSEKNQRADIAKRFNAQRKQVATAMTEVLDSLAAPILPDGAESTDLVGANGSEATDATHTYYQTRHDVTIHNLLGILKNLCGYEPIAVTEGQQYVPAEMNARGVYAAPDPQLSERVAVVTRWGYRDASTGEIFRPADVIVYK